MKKLVSIMAFVALTAASATVSFAGHAPATGVNESMHDITYLGAGWTGGASDVQPGAQNFSIIENGGNRFDHNTYRVPDGVHPQFVWGHSLLDLTGFRVRGQERNSILLPQAKSSE